MAKILFKDTLISAENNENCGAGLLLEMQIYPDTGINTVVLTKSSSAGQHNFYSFAFNPNNNIEVTSTRYGSEGKVIFNYSGSINEPVSFFVGVVVAQSKLNVFKAEVNPGQDIVDYITVDCLIAGEIALTPTPTLTNTPTSTRIGPERKLFNRLYLYDGTDDTRDALDIGETLYKNNVLDKYRFDDLNDNFLESEIVYVRKEKENVIYKIQKSAENEDAKVIDFILCPSQTPTPTYSPTPSVTPTYTPTHTTTSTTTPTNTITNTASSTPTPTNTQSPTSPLQSEDYYISHSYNAVCELPPIADEIVPYYTTKKFRVDRFSSNNEILSNNFDMNCNSLNSFIINVGNLTLGNTYEFDFSIPHPSVKSSVSLEPNTDNFVAKDSTHNINIVTSYGPSQGKFLVKFTLKDITADITEEEFFIFECIQ